jgi:basic amino acid/polyamine antiporter, APA family
VIIGSALYERPVAGGLGIATVLAGTPLYLLWRKCGGVRKC